jgi:hypothetical protein
MGRGGGEGRVPSLMTSAVEREVSNVYFLSFFFDVSPIGHSDVLSTVYDFIRLRILLGFHLSKMKLPKLPSAPIFF